MMPNRLFLSWVLFSLIMVMAVVWAPGAAQGTTITVTLDHQVASAQTIQPPATIAYVTNWVSDTVSVIDTSTNMVIATIPVGDAPRRLAFSPDGTRAYVANELSNNVSVIDTLTSAEIDVDGDGSNGLTRIPVGTRPMGIEVSPDGNAVYVANEGSDNMSVIKTATNTVTATVSVAGGIVDTPKAPAFKPDGSEVWASGGAVNSVKRFAFPANTDLGTIGNVMGFATRIKFLPDGSFAFVQNPFESPCSGDCGTGNLQKISTASNSVISTLKYGTNGHPGMAISPDGKFVYAGTGVGCSLCSQLLEIDTSTMTVTRTLSSIGAPSGIAIPPEGNLLYVTTGLDHVLVIRRSDLAIVTTIPVGGPGGSPTDIAITTIDRQGPLTSSVVATPNPVAVNTAIVIAANVDDSTSGGSDIASAEFSIDGGSFVGISAGDGAFDTPREGVTASIPAFSSAAVHEVCVRGTDANGNVGAPECLLLAVYDPDGGFVTGGGWINSPEGAYTADPTLIGKATFGFVSKYKTGATNPTGETEFQFKVADLNFHSVTYDWLVIAGARAQYKGSGTINNTGDYGFMLTGIDEALTPSTEVDLFRIKIWDKNYGDTIVYDNQAGVGDGADPTTVLGGGNIVIHKGNKKELPRIAFQTDRDGNFEIYLMSADGPNPTNLTNNPAAEQSPAWSPDGNRISFQSFRDSHAEIYVMNADGSGQTNLTNNPGGGSVSTWSPDGTKIAFDSYRNVVTPGGTCLTQNDPCGWELYVMNADGTNQTRLTHTGLNREARNPAWSPDGTKIAFDSNPSGGQTHDIYTISPDGTNQIRLTTDPERDQFPAWSPDGTKIAFASHRDGNYEIYVMNADGANQVRLTTNVGFDGVPTWSPDGTKIAFQSDRDGNSEVYVMNVDGSSQTNVTNNPAEDGRPAWSPKLLSP